MSAAIRRQRRIRNAHRRNVPALTANVRSVLSQRLSLAGRHGSQFSGARDLYATLGYPKDDPDFLDYMARYTRQDVAGTIVDFPAEETWRDVPEVKDGQEKDAGIDTPFEAEWRTLAKRINLWRNFEKADKLAGVGQYAILLFGVAGDSDLSTPLERVASADSILYVRPYSEDNAEIDSIEDDAGNRRFGLPKTYRVSMGTGGQKLQRIVHASRVLHIAENALENDIYGRPRLQRVFNRLMDLEKVVGGSSEATWLLIRKGFALDLAPDAEMSESDTADLEEQLDEYTHGIRRFLKTRGLTPHDLGSDVVDPTGIVDVLMSLVAATTGIPKRILMGSERGELASTQDATSWAGRIARRRTVFAETTFIDEVIRRFMGWGALPAPASGEWSTVWQPLFEMSEAEKAQVAVNWADAFERVTNATGQPVIGVEEFREMFTLLPAEGAPDVVATVAGVVGNSADAYSSAEMRAMITAASRILARGE